MYIKKGKSDSTETQDIIQDQLIESGKIPWAKPKLVDLQASDTEAKVNFPTETGGMFQGPS